MTNIDWPNERLVKLTLSLAELDVLRAALRREPFPAGEAVPWLLERIEDLMHIASSIVEAGALIDADDPRCILCGDATMRDLAGELTHVNIPDKDHEPKVEP